MLVGQTARANSDELRHCRSRKQQREAGEAETEATGSRGSRNSRNRSRKQEAVNREKQASRGQGSLSSLPKLKDPWKRIRRRPTLPGRLHPSTIGAGGLNFRVRNGNGCGPTAITTGKTGLPIRLNNPQGVPRVSPLRTPLQAQTNCVISQALDRLVPVS